MRNIVIVALLALSFTTGFTCSKNAPEQAAPVQEQMAAPAETAPAAPTEAAPAAPAEAATPATH